MSYFRSINQAVAESTGNSSTSNLAAYLGGDATGADTFIGAFASTLGVNAIQVGLNTNKNCTVWVEQSNDSSNWDLSDPYNYYAGINNFGVTTQAISSYTRTRVRNISDASTSFFRLSTVLCPIVEALPRSLSAEGNLKVGVYEIEDDQGNKVAISPSSALKTTAAIKLVGVAYDSTVIDTNFWTSDTTNSGTGVQTGGQFQMRTNTSTNGGSALQSVRVARYMNGSPNYCRVLADYGGVGVANNTKRWGAFTGTMNAPIDGCMFELINQVPTLATYKAGVPNRISNGSFNGKYGSTLNAIPSGLQIFEIVYNNSAVWFFFNNVLVHKISASTATWSNTLSLPVRAENVNTSSGTTDTSLLIRSFTIYRMGEAQSRPHWRYFHGVTGATILKRGLGTLHKVVINAWVNGSTVSVYDALSATNPITLIVPTSTNDAQQPFQLTYDLDFYTGLTITIANAATDVTFIYE